MRILTVFGTRPEAIKLAPVVEALRRRGADVKILSTGQHREMLDQALDVFSIRPDFDLSVMKHAQSLTEVTCAVLEGAGETLRRWRPGLVIVQGDTTTAFAAALAAFYERIPAAHVEAGLRTGNIYSPWPEEMNRKLVTAMAALHFAPTERAKRALLAEGVSEDRIEVTGNTVIDSLLSVVRRIDGDPRQERRLAGLFPFIGNGGKMILVTGHRRESFGEGFQRICEALLRLSEYDDSLVVYPVHLNPNVQEPVKRILGGRRNVILMDPQDYLPFVYLLKSSYIIISDSGGIQEEAPSLGKPVLVTRDTTERPEGVEAGTVDLVGSDPEKIVARARELIEDPEKYEAMSAVSNPYGDGKSGERIAEKILAL